MAVSQLNIAAEKDKHFCCLFLNAQHQLIAFGRPLEVRSIALASTPKLSSGHPWS